MDILGLVDIPVWLILVVGICVLYYFYASAHFRVFTKMGVKGPKPWVPLGNLYELISKGIIEAESEWVRKYGPIYGIHEGRNPLLIIGDLDMLKDICVKEFNSFPNRRAFGLGRHTDKPMSDFLTIQADDEWRHNRNTLTPTFSSGKIKRMTGMVTSASENLVKALESKADRQEPVDIKTFMGNFTMEVIASFAFGMKVDAHADPNDPFIKNGLKFFDVRFLNPVLLSAFICPFLIPFFRFFNLSSFPMDAVAFFEGIINQVLKQRRQESEKHNDFLQLMLTAESEAQTAESETETSADGTNSGEGHWVDKRKGKGLTDSEILANSIMMFTAGFDTTGSALSYAVYHLAKNPDVQEKLIAEIDEHFPGDKLPGYDEVGQLPYLDMVISETLRINPPAARLDRECKKDCTVGGLHIPQGVGVALPIYNIHHDARYWPEPETFDPERFIPEKKKSHHPLQWIPFGYGPRNCIGMRLAILEMKIALVYTFKKYRFEPNEKTVPLRFGESLFLTQPKDGVWVTPIHRS